MREMTDGQLSSEEQGGQRQHDVQLKRPQLLTPLFQRHSPEKQQINMKTKEK